jgi:ABC-2 type transport system permease protein
MTGMTVSGFDPPADPVYILLEWASPVSLFSVVTNLFLGVPNSSGIASTVIVDLQRNVFTNIIVLRTLFGEDVPVWYLHPAIGLVGLLLWFGIPFGTAILRFRAGDIG